MCFTFLHFHFIYIVAKKIWNNLLEPVGGKSSWTLHNSDNLRCPTRSDPFIGTYLNSQDDFELDEEVKYVDINVHITRLNQYRSIMIVRCVFNQIYFYPTKGN